MLIRGYVLNEVNDTFVLVYNHTTGVQTGHIRSRQEQQERDEERRQDDATLAGSIHYPRGNWKEPM